MKSKFYYDEYMLLFFDENSKFAIFWGVFLQMLSAIDDVTACSDSHNMQLGSKLSSSVLRVSAC